MKVLSTISYYTPHISGLTLCVKRLIDGLARHDISFTVLTSQHNSSLLRTEKIENAHVVRIPVLFTIGKVPVMPAFPFIAWKLVRQSDIVWIHVPQIEGLLVAWYAKLLHKKIMVTVHCLPLLPSGWQRMLFQPLSDFVNNFIIKIADHVVYYTKDYVEHTKELFYDPKKSSYIFPPIPAIASNNFNHRSHSSHSPYIVGFAGRIAEDKGLEYLIEALEILMTQGKKIKLLVAGSKDAVGEKAYVAKIDYLLSEKQLDTEFLGGVTPDKMVDFYQQIDCLVLPSVNRTEAFGMVQVEAMKCGVPVIASDLPGVRIPISLSRLGAVVKPKNSDALAREILTTKRQETSGKKTGQVVENIFSYVDSIASYREVLENL